MIAKGSRPGKKEPFRPGLFNVVGNDKGYLIGTRCERCKINFFPGREFCSGCFQNDRMKELILSQTGSLYTFTTIYRGKPNFRVPYMVGYVDLQEGVRVFAPLLDTTPEELKVGMAMELIFRDMDWVSGEENLLAYGFRPIKK